MSKRMCSLIWGIVTILLCISCSPKQPTSILSSKPAGEPLKQTGQYEKVDCTFQTFDQAPKMECGVLTVLEDRTKPDGKKIKLPVAIFKTQAETPAPDPILILVSNPSSVMDFAPMMAYFLRNLSASRDFIVMEQRGVGKADPNLECPGIVDFYSKHLDQDPRSPGLVSQVLDLHRACHDTLVSAGNNLAAYTSETTAADFEELRLALKINQWNVYSAGYGSRLALILMRNWPQGIRSVVLDSPLPPQVNVYNNLAVQDEQVIDLLFQRCAEDLGCNKAYPDLKSIFYQDVDQLNTHPLTLNVADPQSGGHANMWVNGDSLISAVLNTLSSNFGSNLPLLPRMIYQIKDGKYSDFMQALSVLFYNAPYSVGMQSLIYCGEELNLTTFSRIKQSNANAEPHLEKYANNQAQDNLDVCNIWKVDPSSIAKGTALVKEPVSSGTSALVFTGDFNASLPASWAEQTAASLSASTLVDFPGADGVIAFSEKWNSCAQSIASAFFANPSAGVDTTCAKEKKSYLWITLTDSTP